MTICSVWHSSPAALHKTQKFVSFWADNPYIEVFAWLKFQFNNTLHIKVLMYAKHTVAFNYYRNTFKQGL